MCARVKQPAVIGRQADRAVALVDRAAQIVERRTNSAPRCRKTCRSVSLRSPTSRADPVAQAVVVVAAVVDRKKVAVFGIKDEQQPIEKDQRGVANVLQRRGRRAVGDGARELGKTLSKTRFDRLAATRSS